MGNEPNKDGGCAGCLIALVTIIIIISTFLETEGPDVFTGLLRISIWIIPIFILLFAVSLAYEALPPILNIIVSTTIAIIGGLVLFYVYTCIAYGVPEAVPIIGHLLVRMLGKT